MAADQSCAEFFIRLLRTLTARSEYNSIFFIGVFSNRWMVWAVAVAFLLVLLVVDVPFLSPFFYTVPLTRDDWLFMLAFFPRVFPWAADKRGNMHRPGHFAADFL